jgi:oligo-1,6-glucosidase
VKGITSRIDYLKQLGIDIVWTSLIYKSPQADMGYDIADYKDIDPMYGSLAVSTSSLQSSKSAV